MISDPEAFNAMDDQAHWAETHREALRRAGMLQPVRTGEKKAQPFAPGVIEGPKPGVDPLATNTVGDALDELLLGLVLMLALLGLLLVVGAALGLAQSLGWIDWPAVAVLLHYPR